MGWRGSNNMCNKYMCLKETTLRAQNMLIVLGSIHDRGDLYDQFNEHKYLHFVSS